MHKLGGHFTPTNFYNIDSNGRSFWKGVGASAPASEKKEAASGEHVLNSVETTEAFLSSNGIKFKVSKKHLVF